MVRVQDGTAHYTNLQLCGSVWACPVCSAKVRQGRAEEIKAILSRHLRAGGGAYFGMFTLPHDFGDALEDVLDTTAQAFRRVLAGRGYTRDRETYGIVGTIRSCEITFGPNGAHPHIHPVILTERRLSTDELESLRGSLFGRWRSAVEGRGYRTPDPRFSTLTSIRSDKDVADYVAKVEGVDRRVALEVTRSDMKKGRESASRGTGKARHRTAFQVLEDFAATGDADDLDLWREYEKATKGRQAITFSRGLRARYGLEERTDEEINEAEVGGEDVFEVADDAWVALCKKRGAVVRVLELVETKGRDAAANFVFDVFEEYLRGKDGAWQRVRHRTGSLLPLRKPRA